jgi:L-malate glycosyltransferase
MGDSLRKNLRVLIVAPSFDILGGQSVQAARLADRLREEPSLEIGFLPINPRLPGPLKYLQKIKYVRTIVTSIAYVLSLLARVYKYDVIHVFSASYASFVIAPTPAIVIGKLYRRKVLLNYHSGEAEDHLQRWRSAVPTLRLADTLIVPSDYLVRVFDQFGLTAHAIYNLVDTGKLRFRDRIPLRPKFLSNRNFEVHYGVDRILRAFKIIQERFPEAALEVVGDGSQRRALETLAQELELRNITFRGQVNPNLIGDVYDAADIYLNASEIDNQPLSILEAFLCGLPIVTTDAGGIPYMVEDRRTAMMVPRGDYVQLAERAIELLSHESETRQIVERARAECLKYSWAAVRDKWLGTYFSLSSAFMRDNLRLKTLEE